MQSTEEMSGKLIILESTVYSYILYFEVSMYFEVSPCRYLHGKNTGYGSMGDALKWVARTLCLAVTTE